MSGKSRKITIPFAAVDGKPYIFASYGHDDKETVFPLIKRLYEHGYNVWYDEGIEVDAYYDEVIAEHVYECEVLVLFVSNHSVTREYVTKNELGYANRLGKTVLPLFIEDDAALPRDMDMWFHEGRYHTAEEIIAQLEQMGVTCFGQRKAVSTEVERTEGWVDDREDDSVYRFERRNLVNCTETPYAYVGMHPDERSVAA